MCPPRLMSSDRSASRPARIPTRPAKLFGFVEADCFSSERLQGQVDGFALRGQTIPTHDLGARRIAISTLVRTVYLAYTIVGRKLHT